MPLILLIVLLVNSISPMRVGFWAIISVIAMAGLRGAWALYADGPMTGARIRESVMRGIRMVFESLELGARNAVAVSIACAVAGIIVGVVGLTGLGLKFSSMMISLSGGNIVIALGLVLIASLILGLGLPVTASYIVLIVLVGPALNTEFGIPLLIAHLVVFWYSQDSNVTPPGGAGRLCGRGDCRGQAHGNQLASMEIRQRAVSDPGFHGVQSRIDPWRASALCHLDRL